MAVYKMELTVRCSAPFQVECWEVMLKHLCWSLGKLLSYRFFTFSGSNCCHVLNSLRILLNEMNINFSDSTLINEISTRAFSILLNSNLSKCHTNILSSKINS